MKQWVCCLMNMFYQKIVSYKKCWSCPTLLKANDSKLFDRPVLRRGKSAAADCAMKGTRSGGDIPLRGGTFCSSELWWVALTTKQPSYINNLNLAKGQKQNDKTETTQKHKHPANKFTTHEALARSLADWQRHAGLCWADTPAASTSPQQMQSHLQNKITYVKRLAISCIRLQFSGEVANNIL